MEIFNDEGDKARRRTKIGGLLNFTKKTGNEKQTPENIRKQKEEKEQAELCEKTRCCGQSNIMDHAYFLLCPGRNRDIPTRHTDGSPTGNQRL